MSKKSIKELYEKLIWGEDKSKILICSKSDIPYLLNSKSKGTEVKHIISIGASDDRLPSGLYNNRRNVLRLEFEDYPWPEEDGSKNVPLKSDVEEIIKWGKKTLKAEGTIICHCKAGISRSSASAFILYSLQFGLNEEGMKKAKEMIIKNNPGVQPNYIMIAYADELLEMGGLMKYSLHDMFIKDERIKEKYIKSLQNGT